MTIKYNLIPQTKITDFQIITLILFLIQKKLKSNVFP